MYKKALNTNLNSTLEKPKITPNPKWIRVKLPTGKKYTDLRNLVEKYKLNTICTSGSCPNMGECWGEGTATFMILGNICTRSCGFCGVKTGRPDHVDWSEPEKVANSIKIMKIKHAVITSVDRDDLKDMGSIIWYETIKAIRRISPEVTLETLIPDFQGNKINLKRIIDAKPEVISHNVETVKRLTHPVRDIRAGYQQTLDVLAESKRINPKVLTKTSLILGLGETDDEIEETMDDLIKNKVDILTLGQYLRPTLNHLPVERWVTPEEFDRYRDIGLKKGFLEVVSGPMVRSSYRAERALEKNNAGLNQ